MISFKTFTVAFIFIILTFFISTFSVHAQTNTDVSKKELKRALDSGYTTKHGWRIKEGDYLYFGKGTLPNKSFAYIYSNPKSGLMAFGNASMGLANAQGANLQTQHTLPLTSTQAKKGKVSELLITGTKKGGYSVIAKIGIGSMIKYWVEIDNAIDAGELLLPDEFNIKN